MQLMLPGQICYPTLLHEDKEVRKQYRQYKIDSIRKTIYLYGLALIACLIFAVTIALFIRSQVQVNFLWFTIISCALFGAVYLVGKKSDRFVYLIPLVRIMINGIYLFITREIEFRENQCTYDTVFIITMDETFFGLSLLLDIVLLSPSMNMTLLTYTPIFIGSHVVEVLIRFYPTDLQTLVMKICLSTIWLCLVFLVYYLLFLQDLVSFQAHLLTTKKE